MYLKVLTPSSLLFSGNVEKVEIPTSLGVIGILPWHISLTTLIVPWNLKFVPREQEERILDETQFLFEDDARILKVDEWLVYVDDDSIDVFTRGEVDNGADTRGNVLEHAHLEMKNLHKNDEKDIIMR